MNYINKLFRGENMKKTVSVIVALALLLGVSVQAFSSGGMRWLYNLLDGTKGTTYYVDSVAGCDDNDGTSKDRAWKTIDRVNSTPLSGGDKVLFKSGCTFIGQLMPIGSGSAEDGAISIGRYSDGALPIIDANGATENDGAVIRLYNQEYIEISELELTSSSSQAGRRNGILVIARDFGRAEHIYISDCNIHDVVTNARKETVIAMQETGGDGDDLPNIGSTCGAIAFMSLRGGARIPTAYNDILINSNTISKTGANGSGIIFSSDYNSFGQDGFNDDDWSLFYGSTNVLITNNDLKNTAQAIRLQSMDGGVGNGVVVEHNVSYKPDNSDSNSGMWLSSSKDVIWQYNEIYGLDNGGMNDCGAFDADGNTERTVFQYNYTHDNRGEAVMFCNIHWNSNYSPTNAIGNIYRYNISQNDMWGANSSHGRFWVQKGAKDSYFYNNVVYIGEGLSGHNIAVQESENNYFYNNIFINKSDASSYSIIENTTTVIENNCFYGYHPESEPELDESNIIMSITDNSPLVNAGSGGIGIDTLDGYKLADLSPCKGKGKAVSKSGGKDFFGNAFTKDCKLDIGVHQTDSFVDAEAPSEFKVSTKVDGIDSITLSWNEADDNAGVQKYVIHVDGKAVGVTDETTFTADELLPNTEYSFFVRAFDASGNSTDSPAVSASTKKATDAELMLSVSSALTYDINGNECNTFSPEGFAAARFKVVDGNNKPIKNARVEVLVSAKGQNDYKNLASYTDDSGIAQIGFYADYYPSDTEVSIAVTDVIKSGFEFSASDNDNVSVTVLSQGTQGFINLIENPDFEECALLGAPIGWNIEKSDNIYTSAKVEENIGYNGGRALHITSGKGFEVNVSQSITTAPDGIYTLTLWVKNTADSLVVTLNDSSCIVGADEHWQQICLQEIAVTNRKLSLNISAIGSALQSVVLDKIELSKNLIRNSRFERIHPSVHLPSNFYYETNDCSIAADATTDNENPSSKLRGITLVPEYGSTYLNVLKVGSDDAFDIKMGQQITNLQNGVYTFSIKALNMGDINAVVTVKDHGGEAITKRIKVSSKFAVTKIEGIEVTSSKATIELSFSGEGGRADYLLLSEPDFSFRTDRPEHDMVTPAHSNLLAGYNNSFENNESTAPAKWKSVWKRGTPEFYITDEDSHSGNYSTKIVLKTSDDAVNFKPEINIFTDLSSGYYTFSAWVKGTYKVKVTATADDVNSYEKYSKISDEWHKVTISNIYVSDGKLTVGFWNAISTGGEVYALLDDVELVRSTASYDVAKQIKTLEAVEKGDMAVTLPVYEGFEIDINASSDENIIKTTGDVVLPRYDTVVALELCVKNKMNGKESSFVTVDVPVCGIQTDENLSYVFGDANSDQKTDILDIIRMKKYLSSAANEINLVAVDDDLNGILTVDDMVVLRKILLKSISYEAFAQGDVAWNENWDSLLGQ